MNDLPLVAIIILNWNGKEDTLACIESLQKMHYANKQIIIVDNASTDDSIERIKREFPELELVVNSANLGYAGGNNAGIRYAVKKQVDYLLLLNNDTIVDQHLLNRLVQVMNDHPQIGAVSPMIYYHTSPDVFWFAGGVIDRQRSETVMLGCGEPDRGQFGEQPFPIDYANGCAMMIRSEVLNKVGFLDERFFMYYEEVEWCHRIRKAGYDILAVPGAKVWHKIDPDRRNASARVHYLMTRNRLLWIRLTGLGTLAISRVILLEYFRTWLSWNLRPCWRDKRVLSGVTVKAVLDYFKGKFGEPKW